MILREGNPKGLPFFVSVSQEESPEVNCSIFLKIEEGSARARGFQKMLVVGYRFCCRGLAGAVDTGILTNIMTRLSVVRLMVWLLTYNFERTYCGYASAIWSIFLKIGEGATRARGFAKKYIGNH